MNSPYIKIILPCLLVLAGIGLNAQESAQRINVDWDHERHIWDAWWITHPTSSRLDYGVFHFRKSFEIDDIPDSLIIYVSADNRYRLWINGIPAGMGPARGSTAYWRYEKYDIAPLLKKGTNLVAAQVFGPRALSTEEADRFVSDQARVGRLLGADPLPAAQPSCLLKKATMLKFACLLVKFA